MATEEKAEGGFEIHPFDQFEVKNLFNDGPVAWYSITNVTLWMALAVLCVAEMLAVATKGRAIIPTRGQSIAELAYGFIY